MGRIRKKNIRLLYTTCGITMHTAPIHSPLPQPLDFIEVSGVAFHPQSGIMVTLNREVEER